ncbi:hypothetical protein RDWZM_007682 [Blomia tropicalis]|uniref:Uncharacterized protein n=1 Tax=Blomia tropicalis TaxID=40697 RepID=A0A9Q0LZK4_BLOTA|nr:hypothetical protein RDWZM_007682 [Blomia tropicalis]
MVVAFDNIDQRRQSSVRKWYGSTMSIKTLILLVVTVLDQVNGLSSYQTLDLKPTSTLDSNQHSSRTRYTNITQDLLDVTKGTHFNFSHWICLDRFLSGKENYEIESMFIRLWEPEHKQNECTCFLNGICAKPNGSNNYQSLVNQYQLSIWLRCYGLEDSRFLNSFIDKLNNNRLVQRARSIEQSLEQCIPQITLKQPMILRTDLIKSRNLEPTVAFQFIEQLKSRENIQLQSLSIEEWGIRSISASVLSNMKHLRMLSLSYNNLSEFNSTKLFPGNNRMNITKLDLNSNYLERVDLSQLTSLRSLNLSSNYLTTLHKNQLPNETITTFREMKNKKRPLLDFNFSKNPWKCDSELSWFIEFISSIVQNNPTPSGNNSNIVELFKTEEPECTIPTKANMFPFSVWKSVQEASICNVCDCFLEEKYAKIGYRYVVVNCTGRGIDYLPTNLPKNVKIIDLSNNNIRTFSTSNLPKLVSWSHINKIILQNNSLEGLDGLNQIHSIVYLDISGNLLKEVPYHILTHVMSNKIDKIKIGDNPYICDCDTVKMQKWLQHNYRFILDHGDIRCGYMREELAKNESNYGELNNEDNPFYNREILKLKPLELCPSTAEIDFFDLINCLLAFAIIFLLTKVTYDYFWQKRTGKLPRFFKINV